MKLGDVAKDSITGFSGTVVCISEWLHGCRRITIQPHDLHEGKPVDSLTFDEPQLVLVTAKSHQPLRATGGPRPEPVRR